jgi:hypothetical protein
MLTGGPVREMGVFPRSDSVGNLMSVSASRWHGMPMLTIGGTGQQPGTEGRTRAAPWLGTASEPSHVPIVIAGSPIFTVEGALRSVRYAVVMVVLMMMARATRSATDAVRGMS